MADYVDISSILNDVLNDESTFEANIKKQLNDQIARGKIGTNLDAILFALDALHSKITIRTYSNKFGTFYNFSRHRGLQTSSGELMTYGAKVVYSLREFFNQEQINFAIGITTFKGEHKAATISQHEVMRKLSLVSKKAIGLTNKVEHELIESENSQAFNNSIMSQWSKIVEWADTKGASDGSPDAIQGQAHVIYQNNKKDRRVYAKFSGAGRQLGKYYDNEIYFNNGWLWQWFLQLAYGTEGGQDIIAKMQDLSYFFYSGSFRIENILGTKEGDIETLEGIQVQAKMNNNTIIRFNTILQIISELRSTLLKYKNALTSQETIENVSSVVKEFLMPMAPKLNREANEIVENLLKPPGNFS